jgi:hypothetical protein
MDAVTVMGRPRAYVLRYEDVEIEVGEGALAPSRRVRQFSLLEEKVSRVFAVRSCIEMIAPHPNG